MIEELSVIEGKIAEMENQIHKWAVQFRKEGKTLAKSKADWAEAEATELEMLAQHEKEFPQDKCTDKIKSAKVIVKYKAEYRAMKEAEFDFESSKEVLRALSSELNGLQTRAGLFKQEWIFLQNKT